MKRIFSIFIVEAVIVATLWGAPFWGAAPPAFAQLGIPFGGPTIIPIPCTDAVLWLIVGPPSPGSYMVTPATVIYLYGLFHPLSNNLGFYEPVPIICFEGPIPIGEGFYVFEVGTSL